MRLAPRKPSALKTLKHIGFKTKAAFSTALKIPPPCRKQGKKSG